MFTKNNKRPTTGNHLTLATVERKYSLPKNIQKAQHLMRGKSEFSNIKIHLRLKNFTGIKINNTSNSRNYGSINYSENLAITNSGIFWQSIN